MTTKNEDMTRTRIAKQLRTTRNHIRDYEDRARRSIGINVELNRSMAREYRAILTGALDMLDTIRGR